MLTPPKLVHSLVLGLKNQCSWCHDLSHWWAIHLVLLKWIFCFEFSLSSFFNFFVLYLYSFIYRLFDFFFMITIFSRFHNICQILSLVLRYFHVGYNDLLFKKNWTCITTVQFISTHQRLVWKYQRYLINCFTELWSTKFI